MWRFISQSYQLMRAKNQGGSSSSSFVNSGVGGGGAGSLSNASMSSSIESAAPHMVCVAPRLCVFNAITLNVLIVAMQDHELLLVELIREVAHRHPKA